ncbi:MAG: hypothetical protein BWY84_00908 [Candidatus Aerophobetes bacterium ADurb.Bin490]|nr:MAG: hypothetical protein BWY84_00908 [Candidatus Aerophobetes bacterium ADurb.Bin490]
MKDAYVKTPKKQAAQTADIFKKEGFFTIFKKSSIAKNTKNGIKTCSSLILAR